MELAILAAIVFYALVAAAPSELLKILLAGLWLLGGLALLVSLGRIAWGLLAG